MFVYLLLSSLTFILLPMVFILSLVLVILFLLKLIGTLLLSLVWMVPFGLFVGFCVVLPCYLLWKGLRFLF